MLRERTHKVQTTTTTKRRGGLEHQNLNWMKQQEFLLLQKGVVFFVQPAAESTVWLFYFEKKRK
jgi:hypothetical protein